MSLKSILSSANFFILKAIFLLLFVQGVGAQEISFGEIEHNFGDTRQGVKLTHDFSIANKGSSDLIIRKISASCGCTAAVAESAVLKPRDQTNIKVTFDTAGFRGDKLKTIRVYSNDPANSSQVLSIRANIIPELMTEPDHVDLNEILVGQGAVTEVSLRRYADINVKIKEVFSKSEFVSASYDKQADKIRVKIDPNVPIGKYRNRFVIKSDSESAPVINIPINFEVVGSLQIEPDSLNFGRVLKSKGKVSQSFKVRNRDNSKNFALEYVKVNHKRISLRELPINEFGVIVVQVDLNPGANEIIRGDIILKAVDDQNEYKVGFSGYVVED